jgi:hypothetical protein
MTAGDAKAKLKDDLFLQMVFQLGPWGKVLAMAIGAGVVMVTLIVVVCFISPGCWGYEWIHRGKYEYSNMRISAAMKRVR